MLGSDWLILSETPWLDWMIFISAKLNSISILILVHVKNNWLISLLFLFFLIHFLRLFNSSYLKIWYILNLPFNFSPNLVKNQLWIRSSTSEIATYNMRRVCVTFKKYNMSKPPYIQIRLFTAKENEDLKQVAFVNYTLNDLKELSQVLGDFMFVDNCKPQ